MGFAGIYSVAAVIVPFLVVHALADEACVPVGAWVAPGSGEVIPQRDMIARLANGRKNVVLLGESHNQRAHHRWQLQTHSRALYAQA